MPGKQKIHKRTHLNETRGQIILDDFAECRGDSLQSFYFPRFSGSGVQRAELVLLLHAEFINPAFRYRETNLNILREKTENMKQSLEFVCCSTQKIIEMNYSLYERHVNSPEINVMCKQRFKHSLTMCPNLSYFLKELTQMPDKE